MAFTYDLATNRGKVRLGLADTSENIAVFTDAEVDHFLSVGGSVDEAINEGIRVLIAAHAARGETERVAELERLLAMRGGTMPTVGIKFGGHVPSDLGFDEI